jgi:hypothetical protein
MKFGSRQRFTVEQLEDRLCPALGISFMSGTLTITGTPVGALQVNETGPGVLKVMDGAINYGSYQVTGNLNLQLTGHPSTIDVNLMGNTFTGNLLIDVGTGQAKFPTDPVTVSGGTVGGTVTLRNGSGHETFDLGKPVLAGTDVPVTVGGDVFVTGKNSSAFGGDSLILVNGTKLSRNLYTTLIDNVLLVNNTAPATVGGNVVANNNGSVLGIFFTDFGVINGNLTILGSGNTADPLGDSITLFMGSQVNGSVQATLGEGINTFDLEGTVQGGLTVTGGSGSDTDTIGATGVVGGAASFGLGEGANSLTFAMGGMVGGNMSVSGGNTSNDLSNFAGTVGGSLFITLGNGTNTFTFSGAVNGTTLSYTGGSGLDSVTVNGTNSFALNVNLGAGADTFTYGAGASVGSATLDFGVDVDTDVYVDNGVIVTWPQTIRNFP